MLSLCSIFALMAGRTPALRQFRARPVRCLSLILDLKKTPRGLEYPAASYKGSSPPMKEESLDRDHFQVWIDLGFQHPLDRHQSTC
jgi:hypothetical protein